MSGALQMIGNVWEWTTGTFGAWHSEEHLVLTETPYRAIRGGAYDTYCDSQCTCHFQSGESPHARKNNIGFRCALSVCDVIFDELHVPTVESLDESGVQYEEEPV